ncbi:MAG: Dam family site-specific DNA-(adenine-N6)-methyltransferase [Clostridia bacterium]|nr:Dam family site-specific DNA-(adenine-N6)-methyltransferase [Clostridia bacterium]
MNTSIKPFIAAVGGKSKLAKQILEEFPDHIDLYIEPFLGGGSILFEVLQKYKPKYVIANDKNSSIINVFSILAYGGESQYEIFIHALNQLERVFNRFETDKERSEFYYRIRNSFNETKELCKEIIHNPSRDIFNDTEKNNAAILKWGAQFIFLNKTSFNSLYRENKKGEYNTPFGQKKSASFDYYNLNACRTLFQNGSTSIIFMSGDYKLVEYWIETFEYEKILSDLGSALCYIDPPYMNTFNRYVNAETFDQVELANFCDMLRTKYGIKIVQSNSYIPEFFETHYADYTLIELDSMQSFHRSKVKEYLIKSKD